MAKKQLQIPGTESPTIRVVEDTAEEFIAASDAAKRAREKKEEAAANLISAMRGSKLSVYKFDGRVVTLSSKAKVTVKDADDEENED